MAIALVGTPASGSLATGGPLTISHTLTNGSGNNRCVVFVTAGHAASGGSAGQGQVFRLTYNGVNMTLLAQIESSGGTTSCASIWYILDASLPATGGSYNVVATYTGPTVVACLGGIYELSGVNQTGGASTVDTSGTLAQREASSTVTATPNIALVTKYLGSYIVDILASGTKVSAPFTTTGTNQTAEVQTTIGTTYYMNSSVMTTTSTGTYTPGWNIAGALPNRQSMAAAAFAAAPVRPLPNGPVAANVLDQALLNNAFLGIASAASSAAAATAVDTSGRMPLHWSAIRRVSAIMQNASAATVGDGETETALHLYADQGLIDALNHPAVGTVKGYGGWTPLRRLTDSISPTNATGISTLVAYINVHGDAEGNMDVLKLRGLV